MNLEKAEILKRRVAAAKLAGDVAEMVAGDLDCPHARRRFVEAIREELTPEAPPEPDRTHSDRHDPLERLGAFVMPFWMHHGKTLNQIPLEYLDWLVGCQEDTLRAVSAYLAQPDGRRGLSG